MLVPDDFVSALFDLHDGDTLILMRGRRSVQLQASERELAVEVVVNDELTSEETQRLVDAGWREPYPPLQHNWSQDFIRPIGTKKGQRVAELVDDVLQRVLYVTSLDEVSYRLFNAFAPADPDPNFGSLRKKLGERQPH